MARHLSEDEVRQQARQYRRFHEHTGAPFGEWADSKDFWPEDREAIRRELDTGPADRMLAKVRQHRETHVSEGLKKLAEEILHPDPS